MASVSDHILTQMAPPTSSLLFLVVRDDIRITQIRAWPLKSEIMFNSLHGRHSGKIHELEPAREGTKSIRRHSQDPNPHAVSPQLSRILLLCLRHRL